MSKDNFPMTLAVRMLRTHSVEFLPHEYIYLEKGGTRQSADELGVDEHNVIKTLVFQDEFGNGLIVLMHGDREVSTKELARTIGVRKIEPCDAVKAMKLTGYQFGGTSPFGTKTELPVYAEKTIFDLDKIYINGGKRGFLVEINPTALLKVLNVVEVNVGI
jgi:Cys-tRNA(Pro) deacylase